MSKLHFELKDIGMANSSMFTSEIKELVAIRFEFVFQTVQIEGDSCGCTQNQINHLPKKPHNVSQYPEHYWETA